MDYAEAAVIAYTIIRMQKDERTKSAYADPWTLDEH